MLVQAYVLLYLRISLSAYDGYKDDYNTHHAQLPIEGSSSGTWSRGGGQDFFLLSLVKMGVLANLEAI